MFLGIEGSYGHIVEHTETIGFTPLAVVTRGPEHNTGQDNKMRQKIVKKLQH